MKFSNGMWLNKENYKISYPAELYDMDIEKDKLAAYGSICESKYKR